MIEQLAATADLPAGTSSMPVPVFSQTAKLYIDAATSLLLFEGRYSPTYRGRQEALSTWAANSASPSPSGAPFALASFAEDVATITRWRLGDSEQAPDATWEFLQTAVQRAQELWNWELRRLTSTDEATTPHQAMHAWMKQQPARERLRGWLYVLRAQGWTSSWRHWPRWVRLAWRSSPRYWIYAAAGTLWSAAPAPLRRGGEAPKSEWIGVREWLPVRVNEKSAESLTWQELAQEIVWNYKTFLLETRS
jgi:hypothetical protein